MSTGITLISISGISVRFYINGKRFSDTNVNFCRQFDWILQLSVVSHQGLMTTGASSGNVAKVEGGGGGWGGEREKRKGGGGGRGGGKEIDFNTQC